MKTIQDASVDVIKCKRDFKDKTQFIQLHQCDYEPRSFINMKTNYAVSMDDQALLIHDINNCIIHNYEDFTHIEVGGVWAGIAGNPKTANLEVRYNHKLYERTESHMTAAKEAALEECIVHAVEAFRQHGIEPVIITHCQSYDQRGSDCGEEIARAGYRIAKKHGFKLDYAYHRGSGKAAPTEWARE